MLALGKQLGRGLGIGLSLTLAASTVAFAQPVDPNGPPPPPPPIVAPPIVVPPPAPPAPPPIIAAPAPAPTPSNGQSGGQTINGNGNNANANNVNPTITANPTNNNANTSTNTLDNKNDIRNDNRNDNDNKNDNRATATNNNTIYIYPPAIPPVPTSPISPPPLVPPPMVAPFAPQRIRLNCRQLCARRYAPRPYLIPPPIAPKRHEYIRFLSFGAHITMLGMAHQPLAGWGTLYGGGLQMTVRSRGHFGFEIAQDFLRGQFKNDGAQITRQSFPVDFTFRGYILPNLDRYHFNMYFGAGFGAMPSTVTFNVPGGDFTDSKLSQNFLEWSIHADAGLELRFKCIALGIDGKILALDRDRSFGDGRFYDSRGLTNPLVPSSTWGVQGRGYLSFWF